MTERATPQPVIKKPQAKDHESFGVMTLIAIVIPIAGFLLGLIYLTRSKPVERKLGEHLLAVSILTSLIIFVCWYILTVANRTTTLVSPTSTPAVVAPVDTPSTWDAQAAYDKITTGMTKAEVADAAGYQPSSCTESEVMGKKMEYCSYGNALKDKALIMVTFTDDAVSDKTKTVY